MRRPTGLSGSDALRGSEEGGSQFDIVTVPELMELPDVGGFADPPSASQPMQNTGEPRNLENDRLAQRDGMDIPSDIRTEGHESPQDSGEAIVVGAVGSAAPWFLTGWVEGGEVDFMIDTGLQVMILATSVFERMCFSDPRVRSRLRPCGRRLVSADSSPLTVHGELDNDCCFSGLNL